MSGHTPPTQDVQRLVAALRAARDPWSRVRLLASGARTLAHLPPKERRQLVQQLGLEGAEQLADLAAGGDPQVHAAIEGALRKLEGDPQRLQQLVSALADPASRQGTLAGLAAYVMDAATAPPAARAVAPVGTAAPAATAVAAAAPVAVDPRPRVAVAPAPSVAATSASAAPAIAAAPPPEVPPPPAPAVVAPVVPAAPAPPPAPAADVEPPSAPVAVGEDDLGALPSWSQRRALAERFATGALTSLDAALALVARIPAAADRRWALGDLARSREWSDAEWQRLLAAADAPSARRRLALARRRLAARSMPT